VPKNFLVTRLQNIGDALVFIPAVRALRQAYPNAKITFLGKHDGGVEILKNCPYIDDTIIVKNRSLVEKIRLIKEFRKRKIDYFIISPQDLGRVPWALLGGAKKIAGFPAVSNHGKISREKFVSKIDVAPNYDTSRTEIENCLRLVEDVIDDINTKFIPSAQAPRDEFIPKSRELEFWYKEDELQSANDLLNKKGINLNDKFVVSAPYSKREAKNWPDERFIKIFSRMNEKWNAKILLIGGKAEKQRIDKLAESIGETCISLSGETSLGECAAIMEKAILFFLPDSGPAFIATAMKTPAVVLYSAADYYRWRVPESATPRIEIFHPFPCNPCKYQICPKEKKCIDSITIDEAWSKCELCMECSNEDAIAAFTARTQSGRNQTDYNSH